MEWISHALRKPHDDIGQTSLDWNPKEKLTFEHMAKFWTQVKAARTMGRYILKVGIYLAL